MRPIVNAIRWVAHEAWEKINVVATWRELKALGKKHGRRFFIFAVAWELVEDVLFPFLAWKAGMPALIPFFLIMHFEPLTYPVAFWAFRTWDRHKGRIPAEPDRTAQSTNVRSASKVIVYGAAATGWYVAILMGLGLPARSMAAFAGLMAAFGFVHERIWHDSNYGIRPDDSVEAKRVLAKAFTYCVVSTTILSSLLRVTSGENQWKAVAACQALGIAVYLAFEAVWAKSRWGVIPVAKRPEGL